MDVLLTVSSAKSTHVLEPLLRACVRCGCSWKVFFTDEGVKALESEDIALILESSQDSAIACHESWNRFGTGSECKVMLGSQTNHSEMVANAIRVVSL